MTNTALFRKYEAELTTALDQYRGVIPRKYTVHRNPDGTTTKSMIVGSYAEVIRILEDHDTAKKSAKFQKDCWTDFVCLGLSVSLIATFLELPILRVAFAILGVVALVARCYFNWRENSVLNARLAKQLRETEPGAILDFVTDGLKASIANQKRQLDAMLSMSNVPTDEYSGDQPANHPTNSASSLSNKDFL